MVLTVIGFWKLREGESGHISHGCPSEVKEMLKEFGDDLFGMTKSFWVTMEDGGWRAELCDASARRNRHNSRRLAELAPPFSVVLAGIADVFE
jgi:hypothetical protein